MSIRRAYLAVVARIDPASFAPRRRRAYLRGAAWRRVNAWHGRLMATYYELRDSWESRAEVETSLYSTELAEFERDNPRPTFKQFLIDTKGSPR